jgi:queuine tRNA-ribosyltransferase
MRTFEVLRTCPVTRARLGRLTTRTGALETPAFMPVGTQATVKTVAPWELEELGVTALLCNTYHLHLRPGEDLIQRAGGLHRFMSWPKPILTDSGGYQVFSLQELRRVDDDGVTFRSHLDGSERRFTPESVVRIQQALGSDVAVVLDEPVAYPAEREATRAAMERTRQWAERSKRALEQNLGAIHEPPLLFGITQGGFDEALRLESARQIAEIGFDGYCIGGLSFGEPRAMTFELTALVAAELPEAAPRWLMGVGAPEDILDAVQRGVDLFDCVLPTRLGRNGAAFTSRGRINLKNAAFAESDEPIDPECECRMCRTFSRGYIRHLYKAGEILAARIGTYHNLHFYLSMMRQAREALREGRFPQWKREFTASLAHDRKSGW